MDRFCGYNHFAGVFTVPAPGGVVDLLPENPRRLVLSLGQDSAGPDFSDAQFGYWSTFPIPPTVTAEIDHYPVYTSTDFSGFQLHYNQWGPMIHRKVQVNASVGARIAWAEITVDNPMSTKIPQEYRCFRLYSRIFQSSRLVGNVLTDLLPANARRVMFGMRVSAGNNVRVEFGGTGNTAIWFKDSSGLLSILTLADDGPMIQDSIRWIGLGVSNVNIFAFEVFI